MHYGKSTLSMVWSQGILSGLRSQALLKDSTGLFNQSQFSSSHIRKWKMDGKGRRKVLELASQATQTCGSITSHQSTIFTVPRCILPDQNINALSHAQVHRTCFLAFQSQGEKYAYLLKNIMCKPLKHSTEQHLELITKIILCKKPPWGDRLSFKTYTDMEGG